MDAGGTSEEETRYLYGGRDNWHVTEEQNELGTTLATYVYGNGVDEIVSMDREVDGNPGLDRYYYLLDEQNTVQAIATVNPNLNTASLKESYEYGDYGQPTVFDDQGVEISNSEFSNSSLFTGRRYDPETGLYHYRTRYMDPFAGRFTSRDTIGIWGDAFGLGNGNAYGGSNPSSRVDPGGKGWIKRLRTANKLRKVIKKINQLKTKCKNLKTGIKKHGKRIDEHKKKLDDYAKDPKSGDHLDKLGKGHDKEIIEGRKKVLEDTIKKHEGEIAKKEAELGEATKAVEDLESRINIVGVGAMFVAPATAEVANQGGSTLDYVGAVARDAVGVVDPGVIDVIEWILED